ncbi:hypothetical protein ABB25_08385 [Stenotrophomonas koreensis]|uniref:DUF5671 domain-containing protein n=1 Tax=Stenotrophomonas koreensis TaxID=266128 RepID=A0A0R0BUJ4_9GAMM|nr:DUF5671 domain-containing protein [Stenotrophomonas koreensis]KRG57834.1 hypothetical protein ABB25_08385 [Stenotrophomonas koreensis]
MAAGSAELERFIEQALIAGHPRAAVQRALLDAGWSQAQIDGAMQQWASVDFPLPVPRPSASLSAREAFEYLVLFTALYLSIWHLGHLLFALINVMLPQGGNTFFSVVDSSRVRFSVSSLIISWPLFVWLSWRIARAVARQPLKRLSPVRRWLTYLTLFIAASVLIGDLISLVNTLLGGELSARFALKTAVVALLAGGVFGWYLHDLRQEEDPA